MQTYRVWLRSMGGRVQDVGEALGMYYSAVNSKTAACLHARYHYTDTPELDWPLVIRVLCPSGEIHDVTVQRVVEYDYRPAMVEQIREPGDYGAR